jgi:3-deoxy-7-phosphoheptulonate synthase
MPVVSEVLDPHDVALCAKYVDILQIGARNMQNYALLREVGRSGHPVLLKRGGMYPTIENWLLCAEYILREGNRNVMLCERGLPVGGGETATRNVLDVSAVAVIHELSHLPVILDPSHATGKAAYVPPLARAAVAAGADGLIIEVHPDPERALSDGAQSLNFDQFGALMQGLDALRPSRASSPAAVPAGSR